MQSIRTCSAINGRRKIRTAYSISGVGSLFLSEGAGVLPNAPTVP